MHYELIAKFNVELCEGLSDPEFYGDGLCTSHLV